MDTASWLTDVYGGRLTGSPNIKAAGDWTVKKLTEWGAQNARLETWGEFGTRLAERALLGDRRHAGPVDDHRRAEGVDARD